MKLKTIQCPHCNHEIKMMDFADFLGLPVKYSAKCTECGKQIKKIME